MSLGIGTLNEDKQLLFYEITTNMDSNQSVCLGKLLGLKARNPSTADIARELGQWIDEHVLMRQEDYCKLLANEVDNLRKKRP